MVGVRFHPIEVGRIDAWAAANGVKRSEAIRRMVIGQLEADGR